MWNPRLLESGPAGVKPGRAPRSARREVISKFETQLEEANRKRDLAEREKVPKTFSFFLAD